MKVLVSHIAEERLVAEALKQLLERALPSVRPWVSSSAEDVPLGADWSGALSQALEDAQAIIALCSPKSAGRPWVNFECGFGHARGLPVIVACHGGLMRHAVPQPLGRFQACDLRDAGDCGRLLQRLASLCGVTPPPGAAAEQLAAGLVRRAVRHGGIGISVAHGQQQWQTGRPTLFGPVFPEEQASGGHAFHLLRDEDRIVAADMAQLSGLVIGSPWRRRMSEDCIAEVEEWVRAGGRLLLLGFELGDRHHDANLGTLARRFGLHPMPDIVGPPCPAGSVAKPYGVPVAFEPALAAPHPLTAGLDSILLANVQTVMPEPGGTDWLRVGRNAVCRPLAGSVVYQPDGTFSTPGGAQFEALAEAGWLPVAAEAPRGLCGQGAVQFIGSWDLFPPFRPGPARDDRPVLAQRLLDWLSGQG